MQNRKNLDKELRDILGSNNVYYQPDLNVRLKYPCIIYRLTEPGLTPADDSIYMYRNRYELTVIFKDPDSDLPERVVKNFRYCRFSGPRFISENLYHQPLTINY
jgi:hypothetical protein